VGKWVALFAAGLALFLAAAWDPFREIAVGPLTVPLLAFEAVGALMVFAAYLRLREVV